MSVHSHAGARALSRAAARPQADPAFVVASPADRRNKGSPSATGPNAFAMTASSASHIARRHLGALGEAASQRLQGRLCVSSDRGRIVPELRFCNVADARLSWTETTPIGNSRTAPSLKDCADRRAHARDQLSDCDPPAWRATPTRLKLFLQLCLVRQVAEATSSWQTPSQAARHNVGVG